MGRKQDRELREARAAEAALAGVLANWGIEMDDEDSTIQGFAFAKQIGEGEAVEYHEVHAMLRDIALESYHAGREVNDGPLLTEIQRLRTIIKTAYSSQGWDIGSMKNLLLPGLDGYENSGWAEYLKTKPSVVFGAAEYEVGYDPTSSRDSWWVTISLMGDHGERGTYTMTDIEGEQMALKIYERIEEGKRRFNE